MPRVLVAFLVAQAALAADPASVDRVADEVLAAHRAGAAAAIEAVAGRDRPDPWRVADVLCARGEPGAARALATAAPRPDTARLAAYVAAWTPRARDVRRAFAAAVEIQEPQGVLEALGAIETGDDVPSVLVTAERARRLGRAGQAEASAALWWGAASAAESLGWLRMAARCCKARGDAAYRRFDPARCEESWRRLLALERRRENTRGVAGALMKLSVVPGWRGDLKGQIALAREALAAAESIGAKALQAQGHNNIGGGYSQLGTFDRAIEHLRRSLALHEEVGATRRAAGTRMNLAITYRRLGDYATALRLAAEAAAAFEASGDARGLAKGLQNLANIHTGVGAYDKAEALHERALAIMQRIGDRHGTGFGLMNLGRLRKHAGDVAAAAARYEQALRVADTIGHRPLAALALFNAGQLREDARDAIPLLERALAHFREMGDPTHEATVLVELGIRTYAKDPARGRKLAARAEAIADEVGATGVAVMATSRVAVGELDSGDPTAALAAAHRGLARLPLLVAGHGQEAGATARGRYTMLYATGAWAAHELGRPDEALRFLEAARAGALLEALGNREAIRAHALPDALRRAEEDARAVEIRARRAFDLARRGRNRARIKEARRGLEAARAGLHDVIGRIQLEAKATASLVYPKPAPLERVRAVLEKGDALVTYALLEPAAIALVVTADGARTVPLGPVAPIERAAAALQEASLAVDGRPRAAAAALAALVVAPLRLEPDVRRLLVCPDGGLAYAPFALMAGGRTVLHVPSATTYELLRTERPAPGRTVLALGDPAYDGRSGHAALPSTRAEARAVGDRLLLGRDASVAGLRDALAGRPRWRAVHLACHGVVDPGRPALSALALADGDLRCLDLYQARIPADLVVLSACETGRGKVVRGEGVVGFTRAFLFAGASGVLASLWKVDDAATRVLMEEFYRLWNPRTGGGVPAAEALRRAQEHVAAQERWRHPYYWAAWQLWGLG